jgi:uncharacterized damage-inducible protein DinB
MKKIKSHSSELIELSDAIRNSTIKRLKLVPLGKENWRISPGAMSFADSALHLIDSDNWMIKKINQKILAPIDGIAGSVQISNEDEYKKLIGDLILSGVRRTDFIRTLNQKKFEELIYDERFGKEVSVWWIIVRGNLDHEIHHRGAIAAALRVLNDSKDT